MSIDQLVQQLRVFVGSTVSDAVLLVVPDEDPNEETSKRLWLQVDSEGTRRSAVFGIGADGQTPVVEPVFDWGPVYLWSGLSSRQAHWTSAGNLPDRTWVYDAFRVIDEPDWGIRTGARVDAVRLAVLPQTQSPTGIELLIGDELVSVVPGVDGGWVRRMSINDAYDNPPAPYQLVDVVS